jgi:tRNA threonylcarbamoyl adenosine modification protein (Sua5/YciO/YrdC/YwlC family)
MLRMPLHPVAIDLLRAVGPMAVSSANVSGQPAALTGTEARDQLGDRVAVYLDGGTAELGAASTIVDLTGPSPMIVREGPITRGQIVSVIGMAIGPADGAEPTGS